MERIESGYSKTSMVLNDLFNFIFALLFIILSIPIFLVIFIAMKIYDKGPIFYRGARLGMHKEIFYMYKFRTLAVDAEKIIGAQLLSSSHNLETKIGKILRDTRLDELPQLFNVLKGDMDFVGPRPERPVIYEKICRHIRGYDKRFLVKPGLIGLSQLYTPHSAPKRIRTFIDNKFIDMKQSFVSDFGIMCYTAFVVIKKSVKKVHKLLHDKVVNELLLRKYQEKRAQERVHLNDASVSLQRIVNSEVVNNRAVLLNINEEAFLMKSESPLIPFDLDENFSLSLESNCHLSLKCKTKRKTAYCKGTFYKDLGFSKDDAGYLYVIRYFTNSPLNAYMVHQYFLQKSII